MFTKGDRVKHTQSFITDVIARCEGDEQKMRWVNAAGTVINQISKHRLTILWDGDTQESIVAIDNVWHHEICGDAYYFDEREEMLVGFCKLNKGHLTECVPTAFT